MIKILTCFVLMLCTNISFAGKNPHVVFETTLGSFTVELFADKAPLSTQNMLRYVKDGFYNGTVFHRVISDFMIQGGGYTRDLHEKTTRKPIQNEATNGLSNKRGTLSMARTSDIHSATSQFFINVVDNARLDHTGNNPHEYGYAVFGQVIAGLNVVDAIKNTETLCSSIKHNASCPPGLPMGMRDVPATPVIIKKAYVQN